MNPICDGCEWKYFDFWGFQTGDVERLFFNHGILKQVTQCPRCKNFVHIDKNLVFYCQKKVSIRKQKKATCGWKKSGRVGGFYAGSHLNINTFFQLISHFLYFDPPRQPFLQRNLGVQQHTVVDWYSFIREVYVDHIRRNSSRLGGPGCVVEIDEALFGRRKYNRGRILKGQWVLGGLERGSRNCFLLPVQDRTARTLIRLIRRWVLPGTTIITDCWRAYNTLSQYRFLHLTVNHSKNFVDPNTGAHTNTVERGWREARAKIPKYGVRTKNFDGYLAEFLFKRRYKEQERMHAFLRAAAELYPPKY